MNVDTQELQTRLDERVRRGRTRVEAAGEVRWLVELEQRMGILSQASSADAVQVIEDWLGKENIGAGVLADRYARFLDERVRIKRLNPPPWDHIDVAWDEWRTQGGG